MSSLCVWMVKIMSAKCNDFLVTTNGEFVILVAMMSQESLHEPRLCVVRINVEYSVKKNLCNLPTFFRNCSRSVTTVDTDHGVIVLRVVQAWCSENTNVQHFYLKEK